MVEIFGEVRCSRSYLIDPLISRPRVFGPRLIARVKRKLRFSPFFEINTPKVCIFRIRIDPFYVPDAQKGMP